MRSAYRRAETGVESQRLDCSRLHRGRCEQQPELGGGRRFPVRRRDLKNPSWVSRMGRWKNATGMSSFSLRRATVASVGWAAPDSNWLTGRGCEVETPCDLGLCQRVELTGEAQASWLESRFDHRGGLSMHGPHRVG